MRSMEFTGTRGTIITREWPAERPRHAAVLVHGYGEHIGRYEHVADVLRRHGAAVCGPDHMGHGRSAGERVLIHDFEEVVADLHTVVKHAARPGLPVVLIGHSMGGMIAARYAQRYGSELAALVLSGPVLGTWSVIEELRGLEEIPETPIDPATLSRDLSVGEAYTADPLVWHGPFKPATVAAFDRCLRAIQAGGPLGDLPTLWVHGEADELVPLGGTSAGVDAIRGTALTEVIYPGARHEVFNETNRAEVLAEVVAFIDRSLQPLTQMS